MTRNYKGIFPILNKKLEEQNIKRNEICEKLEITQKSLFNKLNGRTDFTLNEAKQVRNIVSPGISLDILFQKINSEIKTKEGEDLNKQIDIPTEVLAELTNNKLTSKEFRIFAYIATSKSEVNESTIDVIKNKFNYSKKEILKAIKKLSVEGLIN